MTLFKKKKGKSSVGAIYAHTGEKVTCVNGHVICELANNIRVGNQQRPGDLINWTQTKPETGSTPLPVCKTCDGEFYRNDILVGISLHFSDGWRNRNALHTSSDKETAQENVVPWLASQTDILAEDWEIVP